MAFFIFLKIFFLDFTLICDCTTCLEPFNLALIEKSRKSIFSFLTFGIYKLSFLNFSLLQHFINEIQKQGYSKSSLNSIFVVLSETLKLAVYPYQYIKENLMLYVTKPIYVIQKNDRTDRVINIETFNKIIETCLKDTPYYIPFISGYYTGFRIGEVLGLTWDNIDFVNNLVSLKNTLSYKSNKQYVFNTPKLLLLLGL